MADPTREMITITKIDTSRPNKVGVQISDNRWFGVFDRALWPRLVVGANLNVEWTVAGDNGQYKNITAILGTASGSPASDRERHIIREAALKAACELYAASNISMDDQAIDWVLHTGDRFARWISEPEATDDTPF